MHSASVNQDKRIDIDHFKLIDVDRPTNSVKQARRLDLGQVT